MHFENSQARDSKDPFVPKAKSHSCLWLKCETAQVGEYAASEALPRKLRQSLV